ncbi:hypothetical protein [Burkholderia sp. PU8-34]
MFGGGSCFVVVLPAVAVVGILRILLLWLEAEKKRLSRVTDPGGCGSAYATGEIDIV